MESYHYYPQTLNWTGPAAYPGLVRVPVPGDGSCYFHSIVNAFFAPYRTGMIDGQVVDRVRFIRDLREELADRLVSHVDPLNPDSPLVYDTLSGGNLAEYARNVPEYSMGNMVAVLRGGGPVDIAYHELISNEIDKDIYIISSQHQDIVKVPNSQLLYKDRCSVVLIYHPGHYELAGIRENDGTIRTKFTSSHPYIVQLRGLLKKES